MKKYLKALAVSLALSATMTLFTLTVSAANVGSWSAAAAMGTGRQGASATLLPDGTVLVTGGETASSTYTNTTEVYTPTGSGTWAPGTSMSTQRAYHQSRALPNGKVMVMGGYNGSALNTTEIFDPASPGWTAGPNMGTARYKFATAVLLNGKIMAIGGYDGTNTVLNTTEIYDPVKNIWSAGPNMNTAREGLTASALPDGRIVVFGGYNGTTTLNTAESYNPDTNSWTTIGTTMTTARRNETSRELPDGTVLIAGGFDGTSILNTTEIFNPANDTFTADAALSQAGGRRYAAITQLQDGKILLVGGTPDGSTYLNTTEISVFPDAKEQSTIPQILDLGNNGDARDIRVMFKGAQNEAYIKEYRVFVLLDTTDTTISNGTDAAALNGIANRYAVDPAKGAGRMHLFYLPQTLTRAGGAAIDTTAGSYKVYVLAKGKPGYGDVLSQVSTTVPFAVAATGSSVTISAPTAVDVSNANHNAGDWRIIFRRPKGEAGYKAAGGTVQVGGTATYRLYIVPNTMIDAAFRASSWFTNTNYYSFDKYAATSSSRSYVINVNTLSGLNDINNASVTEGTAYRIYIAAVGATGTVNDSVLSPSSKAYTLSPYVPGVYSVRSISVSKTGTGFTSDLIKVNFEEPANVSGIQDYRIFLVNSNATLTQIAAVANVGIAGDCYVYTPASPGPAGSTSRSVQLSSGIMAYDGTTFNTLVTKGTYKVYVLSYTGTANGNRLSPSSIGIVTLD